MGTGKVKSQPEKGIDKQGVELLDERLNPVILVSVLKLRAIVSEASNVCKEADDGRVRYDWRLSAIEERAQCSNVRLDLRQCTGDENVSIQPSLSGKVRLPWGRKLFDPIGVWDCHLRP